MNIFKFIICLIPGGINICFGVFKVFGGQFSNSNVNFKNIPALHSPDLVYVFFGNSGVYLWAIGFIQMTGGLMILFERTRLLGAFICLVIFTNVVLISLAFHFQLPMKLSVMLAEICCLLTLYFEKGKLKHLF